MNSRNKYLEGVSAASCDGVSIKDNPYRVGTVAYEAWKEGFLDVIGSDDVEDLKEVQEVENTSYEGADIMEN